MIDLTISSIQVHMPDNVPVVLLREMGPGGRSLPILIGHEEAGAIARAIQGAEPPRPLTHDLMRDLLVALGVEVEAIVITELVGTIFYAEIQLVRDGNRITVSSRPSDAIALAVRVGAPIRAEESLMDAEAYVLEEDPSIDEEPTTPPSPEESEEVIEQFQRFIEGLRPEDFKS